MYIEECGYHALDNVYAVKGSTATWKTALIHSNTPRGYFYLAPNDRDNNYFDRSDN